MAPEFTALAFNPEMARLLFVNEKNEVSPEAKDGAKLRFNHLNPCLTRFPLLKETDIVERLPIGVLLSETKVNSMVTGMPEEYIAFHQR